MDVSGVWDGARVELRVLKGDHEAFAVNTPEYIHFGKLVGSRHRYSSPRPVVDVSTFMEKRRKEKERVIASVTVCESRGPMTLAEWFVWRRRRTSGGCASYRTDNRSTSSAKWARPSIDRRR